MINTSFDLFFSLVAAAVTAFLGMIVYLHDRHNTTNRLFIILSFVFSVWSIANYFSVTATGPEVLFLIRIVLVLAVAQVFLFFLFVQNFPYPSLIVSRRFLVQILSLMFLLMILAFTSVVFRGVQMDEGGVLPVPGDLVFVLPLVLGFFSFLTFGLVVQKYRRSEGQVRSQWLSISMGFIVAYTLLIFLVLLQVIAFKNSFFVPYSPLFILPIFIGAGYAIFRHQLFNVKVLGAELLTFALLLAGFIQVLLTETVVSTILGIAVVFFILVTGIILIQNVLKEVRQREQLQELDNRLERANKKLKVLDKARADFITMASHQLRTPPATIKWYLAAILGGDFGTINPDAFQALRKTQSINNALISLIDDMLNVSRIERGKLEFVFEPTDILKIAQFAVDQLVPMAEQKNLKLEFNPPKVDLPKIVADKEKLRQVINNLIDNAIKYTKTGKIAVSLSKTRGNVIIKVSDTGKGMSAEEQKKVFQKFGRGKDANNYSAGLGLGLYLAKVVVETHKGRIWAESKGVGKGSSFLVSLPIENNLKVSRLIYDLTKHQQ